MSLETNGFDTAYYLNTSPIRNDLTITLQVPVAEKYGIVHALIVDVIDRGIPDEKEGAVRFGNGWFCCSYEGFGRILPFVDVGDIKEAIAELEEAGIIISTECIGSEGAKLYRTDHNLLEYEDDQFTHEALQHDEYYDDEMGEDEDDE